MAEWTLFAGCPAEFLHRLAGRNLSVAAVRIFDGLLSSARCAQQGGPVPDRLGGGALQVRLAADVGSGDRVGGVLRQLAQLVAVACKPQKKGAAISGRRRAGAGAPVG